MEVKKMLLTGSLLMLFISCSINRVNSKSEKGSLTQGREEVTKKASQDSTKSVSLKPYAEIITKNAFTQNGLFTVHKINDRYYFEIPNAIIDKDLLLVSRITQGAAGGRSLMFGYTGDEIGESQIKFSKGPANKLFIRLINYVERSADSSANGMYRTVQTSSLQPIQAAFDIRAFRPDSSASVIEVTDFLNSDNTLLYFDADGKKALNLGGYQKDRSYISEIKAYPLNVELQTVNTYLNSATMPRSYGLNVSFVLLPGKPMESRFFDKRVGYFKTRYMDFDAPEGVKAREIICRWRLEPKEEDKERYLRGELVVPQKPIVFYIDPATPKKWVPYLIQGVNDWQKAFEKAGFKNAIYALDAPANDTTFSLFDARHNAIVYKASTVSNASGPTITDKRTGEILESHINWYHNVMALIHDWYMIQAAPNDCGARKMVFDDELMGQLIRFVCSHEVGHTLGLRHNMGASSTVPVDSLRSKAYLDKNGLCPSIMDYARFNYVAQPEDGLSREELLPRIGVYDEWAIEWGYRWLPQLKTREQEGSYMNQWIIQKFKKDRRLWWAEGEADYIYDPRIQAEDLGDDAMKASYYGIQNLKRVMNHLKDWAIAPDRDYFELDKMYKEVVAQYGRYISHVANNFANAYITPKYAGQEGPVIQFIPAARQKRAIKFLIDELFDTPEWLYNKEIFSLVGGYGPYAPMPKQMSVINYLMDFFNYNVTSFALAQQPKDIYSFDEMLSDMDVAIWKELEKAKPIAYARRILQKGYVERLIQSGIPARYEMPVLLYDYYPILQKHIEGILKNIDRALRLYRDEDSRWHLINVKKRLVEALHSTRFPQGGGNGSGNKSAVNTVEDSGNEKINGFFELNKVMKCTGNTAKEGITYSCWYPYNFEISNPQK